MASEVMLQLVSAVLVLAVPLGFLVLQRESLAGRMVWVAATFLVGATASLSVDAVLSSPIDVPARVLDASFAGAVAGSVTLVAARRLGMLGGAIFASLWSILVFQPVFAATAGSVPSLVQIVFGAVDFSAVLATHVAAAASVIALTVLPRNPRASAPSGRGLGSGRALLSAALVALGATGWMVGAERVISDATGRTLGNAVAGLVVGAVVWSLTERIAGRPFSPWGVVMGVVVAWGAIGLGAPFLSPAALGATAVIATASAAAVVVRAPVAAVLERRIAIGIIVAVAVGGVVLALLADGFGMSATGSTALVLGQLGAVIAIGLGALGSGLLCGGGALLAIVATEGRSARRDAETSVSTD